MEKLNIDDDVIVLRKPSEDEEYDTSWINGMSNSIGKKYKIIDISHDYKEVKLNNHYWYPNFVLCKICKIELLEIF